VRDCGIELGTTRTQEGLDPDDGLAHQGSQGHGGEDRQAGNAEHGSRVAAVFGTLAHVRVVLLQDGGVALLGLLLPAAATDHTFVATHILVDFSAVVLLVSWAILQMFESFGLIGLVLEEEWVTTVDIEVAGALVTLDARSCGQDGQDDEDGSRNDKFGVHDVCVNVCVCSCVR